MARIQRDPLFFIREILGVDIWQKQGEIVCSVRDNKRTVVRSCHGIGKSFVASCIAIWWLYSHPGSIVATTAPTFRQVEKILWQEIGAVHARSKCPLGGIALQTEIKLGPKWYAFGFSSDDPNAVQGLHATDVLLIVDEASGIPADLDEAMEGMLTSAHCRLLKIGNPTDPSGPLAKEFKTPGACKIAVSAFDSPNFTTHNITIEDIRTGEWKAKQCDKIPAPWLITPEWVADKFTRWGETSPMFKSRVLGEFPDQGDDTLIPLSWIEAAQQRSVLPTKADKVRLSCDVARFGGDESTIGRGHGWHYRLAWSVRKQDTMVTAGRVMRELLASGASTCVVDSDGVGGGVLDRCKEQGGKVTAFHGGAKPNDPDRFANMRAESYWLLREAFEQGLPDIDPNDDELASQLASLKYKTDSKGRILIESKADMKKRGLPSPDRADTMMMRYAPVSAAAERFAALAAM